MRNASVLIALVLAGAIVSTALAQADHPSFEDLRLELVAEGFVSPVTLTSPPGDDRLFVVDRPGIVYALDQQGQREEEPFLDITDRVVELDPGYDERGLLGFAFHPDFAENGRAFAYYSAPLREGGPAGWNHTAVLAEFTLGDDGRLDPASERVLLEVDQPQMNHNGGQLLFGHDGFLYLGLGDGGAANDVAEGHPPLGNGQDVTTLLGSVLRLDVDSGDPYGIPADNPFADGVELPADDRVLIRLPRTSPAVADGGWLSLVDADHLDPLHALVRGVDPHLAVAVVDDRPDSLLLEVVVHDEPAPESGDVALTRFSGGASFAFADRGTPVAIGPPRG